MLRSGSSAALAGANRHHYSTHGAPNRMTKQEAQQAVWAAVCEVNPNLATLPHGSVGRIGIRCDPRGDLFDVSFANAGHLYPQYADAARNALGEECGVVRNL